MGKIDPLTGLSMDQENLDPLTGLPMPKSTGRRTAFTGFSGMAGDLEPYNKYGVQMSEYTDMDEERAQRQSTAEQWRNGLTKAAVTTAGAFSEATVGTLLGLGDYLVDLVGPGEADFDRSMSNNAVGLAFDKINEDLQTSLPNYYTQEERDEQGTMGMFGSANFWADKFANGAAYTLGTVAAMAVTGGYGAVGGALRVAGATGKVSKALGAYRAAKAIRGGTQTMEALRKGATLKNTVSRIGRGAEMLEAGAMMSMAEAAVESRETKKIVEETLTEEAKRRKFAEMQAFALETGNRRILPESWEQVELDTQEIQQIQLQAQEAEGAAFYGNMAVLMPTNLLMFGKMAAGFRGGQAGVRKLTKDAEKGVYKEFVETLPKGVKQVAQAGRFAVPLAKQGITEGYQEGMQYAISQGASDYELRKFKDSGSGELVSSLMNAGALRALKESAPDIASRASKSLTDPEAREQVIIGAMVGILGGGRSTLKEYQAKKKNTKDVLSFVNSETFTNLAIKAENVNAGMETVRRMMEAEKSGNKALFERLQKELITNQALFHIKTGSMDLFRERWNDLRQLSDEEFKTAVGIDTEFEFTEKYGKDQIIDGILNHADKVEEGYKLVNKLYDYTDPPRTTGLPRLIMGKQAAQEEDERLRDLEIYKNFLIHNYSRMESVDEDILKSLDDLTQAIPGMSNSLIKRIKDYRREKLADIDIDSEGKEKLTAPKDEYMSTLLNEIYEEADKEVKRSGSENGLKTADAIEKIETLRSLIRDRDSLVLAYKNLQKSPKERDLFISRTKAKERAEKQKKIDESVDKVIAETNLPSELEAQKAALKEAGISDKAKEKLENEIQERKNAISDANLRFKKMKKSEVEALEGLSKLEEAARKEHLSRRTQEEPEEVDVQEDAQRRAKEALKRQREEAARKSQQGPPPPSGPAAPQPPQGPEGPPSSEQGQTLAGLAGQAGSTESADNKTVSMNADKVGEFQTTPVTNSQGKVTNRVVVDDFGNPVESDMATSDKVDGKPVITDRELLQSSDVAVGTEVELRVVETDWWVSNRSRPDMRDKVVQEAPVFVFVEGKAVAKLKAGNTALRKAVVEEHLAAKEENREPKKITTKIKEKNANIQISAVDSTGRIYLSNPFEVFGDTPVGVVTFSMKTGNNKVLRIGNTKNKVSEQEMKEIGSQIIANTDLLNNLTYGQVVFLFKDPNGKWRFNVAYTAPLNESEMQQAFQMLQNIKSQDVYEELLDLVGFNSDVFEARMEGDNFLFVSPDYTRAGDRTIQFTAPEYLYSEPEQRTEKNPNPKRESRLVSVSGEVLRKLAEAEAKGEISAELILQIIQDKPSYGNLIKMQDEDGKFQGVGFNFFKQRQDLAEQLIKDIPNLVRQAVAKKRRQVSIGALTTDTQYFQQISNAERQFTDEQRADFAGREGVIGTTALNRGGGIMRDVELDLSSAYSVDGKQIQSDRKPAAPLERTKEKVQSKTTANAGAPKAPKPPGPPQRDKFADGPPAGATVLTTLEDLNRFSRGEAVPTVGQNGEVIDPNAVPKEPQPTGNSIEDKQGSTDHQGDIASPGQDLNLESGPVDDNPFRLVQDEGGTYEPISEKQAVAWLKARGIPVEFYDLAKRVGNGVAHGYMKNAAVYLWKNAEIGTEYHEAFHYMFRMMLTDAQREGLYAEARSKYALPNASELELEEAMAEDFRDYVFTAEATAKTLPGKIRKFFKDIWNYIKAIFSNRIAVDQFFSLIESNRVPAKFERSAERFADTTAYRIVDTNLTADMRLYKSALDTMSSLTIQKINEMILENDELKYGEDLYILNSMLGKNSEDRGYIAEYFLRNSIREKNGDAISEELFEMYRQLVNSHSGLFGKELQAEYKKLGEFLRYHNLESGIPFNSLEIPEGVRMLSPAAQKKMGQHFYTFYNQWFDVVDDRTGNVDKYGWREAVIEDIEKYGYKISTREELVAEMDNEEEDGNYNAQEVEYDKIYAVSHFENDPSNKISQEVKRLFGKMIRKEPNAFGFNTYADIATTYKAAVHATIGLENWNDMVQSINKQAEIFSELVPIAEYLNTEATKQEAGMLRSLFTQDYSQHRFLLETYEETGTSVKLIGSDRRTGTIAYMQQWKNEAVQIELERPAALFKFENDVLVFNNNTLEDGKTRLEHLTDALRNLYAAENVVEKGSALSDVLWYMSMSFGNNKDMSRTRVIEYMRENPSDIQVFQNQVENLLKKAVKAKMEGGRIDSIEISDRPVNFFESESTTVKAIADRAAVYRLPVAMSFISGRGKSIYPYNAGSHFNHLLNELSRGTESELFKKFQEDESFNAFGKEEYQSYLYQMLQAGEATIETFTLDTIRDEDNERNNDYTEIATRESLLMRFNTYFNTSSPDYAYYPISIQESRGRIDFIKMPKFHRKGALRNAGIKAQTKQQIIENIIIRDLIKLHYDPSLANNLGNGFHLSGIVDSEVGGLSLSKDVVNAIKYGREDSERKAWFAEVSRQAKEYLDTTFKEHVKELNDEVTAFSLIPAQKNVKEGETAKADRTKSRLDKDGLSLFSTQRDMVESFHFDTLVARIEMSQLLRGGATQSASVAKFFKRMGLVNTPGTRMMLEGEYQGDRSYGFMKKVMQAVINPIRISDEAHEKIANNIEKVAEEQFLDISMQSIEAKYAETEMLEKEKVAKQKEIAEAKKKAKQDAKRLAAQYRVDNLAADHTDGQAYVSPWFHRGVMMGLGQWADTDETWFQEFLTGGEWKAKYTPNYKFYMENLKMVNGQIKPEMDKNSYVVLTPELVRGNELLSNMYDRMMAQGKYEGMGRVDLINTNSAKKGYKSDAISVDSNNPDFSNLTVVEQDGSKFLIPQVINKSEEYLTKMNRQIRKNIISAVDRTATYTVDGKTMTGAEVLDEYHSLVEEAIVRENKKLLKKLGYDKMKANPNDVDARLNFLKNIRDTILRNASKDGKLDSNMQKQLKIVENDIIDFAVPMAFPAYQRRYQNLIFSLFKNNVHRLDMPGKELVQVASSGKFSITLDGKTEVRELRHIDVDTNTGNLKYAEVIVSEDMLEELGLKLGETGIAYRIPHQGYSSTVPIRIVGVLPKSYAKTIIVPGNITIQTGSDFDIDKLFVMLRNMNDKSRTQEIRNRLLDIMEGITLNRKHMLDTLKPLTEETLNELSQRKGIKNDVAQKYTFDHPMLELVVEANFKSSAALVGTFANGLAGFSVAVHAGGSNAIQQRGLGVHSTKAFNVVKDGQLFILDRIQLTSKMTKRLANAGMTESLSAALDAGGNEDFMHLSLNENKHTASAKLYLQSIGMDEETIVYLMAQPNVRRYVEEMDSSGLPSRQVLLNVGDPLGITKYTFNYIKANNSEKISASEINFDELKEVVESEDFTSPAAKKYFIAFAQALSAGNELTDIYKGITPDTADGMGDLAQIQSYIGTVDRLRRKGDKALVSWDRVNSVLNGDAYPLSRAYYQAIQTSLEVAGELFLGGNQSVKNFKDLLMDVTGKTLITEQEHRFIDRMLFYHMLTKEGSPMGELLKKSQIESTLTNTDKSLASRIAQIMEEIPALKSNTFLLKVAEPANVSDGRTRVKGLSIDTVEKMTPELKEAMINGFYKLLFQPQIYTSVESEQEKIQNLGKFLITNAMVTTGLAPTYGAYFDSIPVDFFTSFEVDGVTPAEFLRKEFDKARKDPQYFADFMVDFVRNFGTRAINGKPLIPRLNAKLFLVENGGDTFVPRRPLKTPPALFATFYDKNKDLDRTRVFMWDGSSYRELHILGIGGQIIELNLRNRDGTISNTSMWASGRGRKAKIQVTKNGKTKTKVANIDTRKGYLDPGANAMALMSQAAALASARAEEEQKLDCKY